MRVLIAAGEMKGSLSAGEAARAIERGVRAAQPDVMIDTLALSDGGAGLVDLMVEACGGERRSVRVTGPLGGAVDAGWGYLEDGSVGVIEMSAAAGLALVSEDQRDPERTTTYGVGELIRAALVAGCAKITIGIGNSATCDAGIGMAVALGAKFFDEQGKVIERPVGADMARVRRVDTSGLDPRLGAVRVEVLCDVTNPLFGAEGSAHIFAPQKGATPEQVERLDAGLRNIASLLPGENADAPGMGAAGGLAFGLAAFCGGVLSPGADAVLDIVGFEALAAEADLVLTSEGRFDETSLRGKLPSRVGKRAIQTRTVILAGSVDEQAAVRVEGAVSVRAISPEGMAVGEAVRRGAELLEVAARDAVVAFSHI